MILDYFLIKRYESVGLALGEMLSYSYMGKACCYDSKKKSFLKLQSKIVKEGFVSLSIHEFINSMWMGSALPLVEKDSSINFAQIIQDNIEIIYFYEDRFSMDFANKI